MLIFVSKTQSFIIGYLRFYLTGGILFNYFSGLLFNFIIQHALNKNLIEDLPIVEIIHIAGKLNYPTTKIIDLLRTKVSESELEALMLRLQTQDTAEYKAYQNGLTQGEMELDHALYTQALSGDSEALKLLKETQRERDIDQAVKKHFFSD